MSINSLTTRALHSIMRSQRAVSLVVQEGGQLKQVLSLKLPLLARSGGGYFFIWLPRETAVITTINKVNTSITVMGSPPFGLAPPFACGDTISHIACVVNR